MSGSSCAAASGERLLPNSRTSLIPVPSPWKHAAAGITSVVYLLQRGTRVRPSYVRAQKNDDNDAAGSAEAATRPGMRYRNTGRIFVEQLSRYDVAEFRGVLMVVVESDLLPPDPTVVVCSGSGMWTIRATR